MSVKQIEALITVVFIALFFLYFFWIKEIRKRFLLLAILEGASAFGAVVMMIIFDFGIAGVTAVIMIKLQRKT